MGIKEKLLVIGYLLVAKKSNMHTGKEEIKQGDGEFCFDSLGLSYPCNSRSVRTTVVENM